MKKFWIRLWLSAVMTLIIFILQTDYILGFGYGAAVACWFILWALLYVIVHNLINKVINKLFKKDW